MPGPPEQRAAGARTMEATGAFLFGLAWFLLSSDDILSGRGESHADIVECTRIVPAADIVGRPGIVPAANLDAGSFVGSGGKGSCRDIASTPNKGIPAVKVGAAGAVAANLLSSNYSGTVRKSSE